MQHSGDSYHIDTAPRGDGSGDKREDSGKRDLRRGEDSGKCHDSQCYIGNIIQERAYETILYLSADQCEWEHADHERYGGSH